MKTNRSWIKSQFKMPSFIFLFNSYFIVYIGWLFAQGVFPMIYMDSKVSFGCVVAGIWCIIAVVMINRVLQMLRLMKEYLKTTDELLEFSKELSEYSLKELKDYLEIFDKQNEELAELRAAASKKSTKTIKKLSGKKGKI